jgi:hypothetical protein
LKEIIFESFNISENNIISVELAKVLGYTPPSFFLLQLRHEQVSFGKVFSDLLTKGEINIYIGEESLFSLIHSLLLLCGTRQEMREFREFSSVYGAHFVSLNMPPRKLENGSDVLPTHRCNIPPTFKGQV